MNVRLFCLLFLLNPILSSQSLAAIPVKTLARLADVQENPLSGYGLVIGLAGSGDSRRNKDTTQAIANVLQSFGMHLNPNDINSRNSATVMVTVNLPAFAYTGDKIDVHVASMGDARSLLGGTLLITPLKGADNQIYALAQGPVSIGGFKYDAFGNAIQKNHPTSGIIPNGAIVEKTLYNTLINKRGSLHLVLNRPDFTTSDRIAQALNLRFGAATAKANSAQEIEVALPESAKGNLIGFISQIENTPVIPGNTPTVVVNERTGIVVAGNDVRIENVTISHGNLQVAVSTEYRVSQPEFIRNPGPFVNTRVTPATQIQAAETTANVVKLEEGSTVADLIKALALVKTSTRDVISILESLKRAGALQAELIIQ